MVDSENIHSGNVLVQSTHPGPHVRRGYSPMYLIMRRKTVAAKGLIFYISTYIHAHINPYSNPAPNPRPRP